MAAARAWASVLLALALAAQCAACAGRYSVAGLPKLDTPDACQTCVVSIRVLEDFLCDPGAVDFLVEFAKKRVCPALGDSPRCHNLAEGLVPVVVQWFRASTTPAALCSSAGVCGDTLLSNKHFNQPALRVKDAAECALCEFVVTKVKTAFNDSSVLEEIKEKALEACATLPENLAEACTEFVNDYEPLIAQLIETADPQEVCTLLGACMQSLVAAARPAPLPLDLVAALGAAQRSLRRRAQELRISPANDGCDYCKMAVLEAHTLVSNPQVQSAIVNYTKSMCDTFPAYADACKLYVDEYSLLVFTLLEQYLVPDTLCAQLGLCPPPSAASVFGSLRTSARQSIRAQGGRDALRGAQARRRVL